MLRASELKQVDVAHVDGDEQRFLDRLIVPLPGVNAALRRDNDSVNVTVFRGVVKTGCAAQDVDRVVVPAEQPIGTKAGDLLTAGVLHVVREGHFKASPGFAISTNGCDLL